jgi:alpha-L-arabinofuranosidase
MKSMLKLSGWRPGAIVFIFFTFAYSSLVAGGQTTSTPTVVNVTSQVQHANVTRLGINMEDQDYWDSAQITKDLTFQNPGFEAEQYRTIINCATASGNTCADTNAWSVQPANFWKGASYRVISGSAMGATGTVLSSTAPNAAAVVGQILTFDKSINMAKGDYVVVTQLMPGNGQHGWWTFTSGGGTITSETTDLSPNTPGKQALSLNASGSGQSVTVNSGWDVMATRSFIQMNGSYQLTFRAKSVSGSKQLQLAVFRNMAGEAAFLSKAITLTTAWQDYTIPFTANENGSALGPLQLNITMAGGVALLDDTSITQTNSDPTNTTAFRDDVVNTLKALNPGTLRMYGGASIGTNLYDEIAPYYARYPEGVVTALAEQDQNSFGIPEFLQLCQFVGADPWITIPTATTPQEITDFMDYLQGDGSTTYSAIRVSQGQVEPWTSVFNKIHLELGNETWNASFQGEIMGYPAYPLWANQVFGAARQTQGFDAAKFDLVLSGFAASPGYTQGVLAPSTQHDSVDAAPYLMFSANNDTSTNLFNALFAEPEMFDSPGGEMYQNYQIAHQAITSASGTAKPTGLNVYEVNMSTFLGSITQSEVTPFETSVGAGVALADHLLQMMRLGVDVQNVFGLTGWHAGASNGNTVNLYGTVVAMGTTNIQRPTFLSEQLANSAIMGDMLATQQTGANPTYNQPLSSDNVQYNGVHYIQSFAFLQGQNHSLVLFNLNQTTALPVTFTGANAPSGTVQVGLLNSQNITDTNENGTTPLVQLTSSNLSSFNPATPYTLPAHSMTVLTWSGAGTETGAAQAAQPVISLASGTYTASQSVSISDVSPGAEIYYTTDGTTPTASSNYYSGPITVRSAETLTAVALGPNYVTSPAASASYAISTTLPLPILTPAAGTYSSAQTVTLTASPGATIYYTTDGSTPTTSSAKYTSNFNVSSSETVQAIAAYSGYSNTSVVSASYNFVSGSTALNFANGFTSSSLTMNGGAKVVGTALQLSDSGSSEARSAWSSTAVPISQFITDFSFQLTNTNANGFTFVVQNAGPTALGGNGGSLGYQGMSNSVALKFDFYTSVNGNSNSTGVYTNGASPSLPAVDLTPTGVSLHSGHIMQAHVVYDGTYLTMNLTDTVTKVVAVEKFAVNIPSSVGAKTAYIGFTAATGGLTATQNVLSLTHTDISGATPTAQAPTFSVPAGTYTTTQTIALADATANSTIYYTTDGSNPTTSSSVFSGTLTVSSTETVKAMAVASGYTASGVSSALYTIQSPATTAPTFSEGTGTYTGTQTVVITDATAGATIHYTTNGSTPTTSSAVYGGPLSVTSTETVSAMATATSHSASAVTTATYTINTPVAATPVFSKATGTYPGSQSVTIADSTPGAAIYFTTNGTVPTTASFAYSGPITIGANTTLSAIAVAKGYSNSAVNSATYTIQVTSTGSSSGSTTGSGGSTTTTSGATTINFASGFTSTAGLVLNHGAKATGGVIQLTDGGVSETRSVWSSNPVTISSFTTDFDFQQTNAIADGLTFAIQNTGSTVVGYAAGGLGYQNIGNSVAVKFDLYNNSGEGANSIGVYQGGAAPTMPATSLVPSGIDLHSGHIMHGHIDYDGTNLVLTLTDTVTKTSVTNSFPVKIPAAVGKTTALVGFTAGTGGAGAVQSILDWTYTAGTAFVAAPVFSPASNTYIGTQNVTLSDSTAGATIHYTTDGSKPTASSPTYTSPVSVSSTATLQAIAVLPGATASAAVSSSVASAAYTIVSGSGLINYAVGFNPNGLQLNGGATVGSGALEITDGGGSEARSAWYSSRVPVNSFTTDFTLLTTNASADGLTFTIQNTGLTALGAVGGSLGYAGIGKSVALKFDLYNSAGEGSNSTGVYLNGAQPKLPSTDLTSTGIDLHSGHQIRVHLTYDGTTLIETLTDATTNATVTEQFPVNIPGAVGATTAYVGFTGATGGATAVQKVLNWTYQTGSSK